MSLALVSTFAQILPTVDSGPQCSLRTMPSAQLLPGTPLNPVVSVPVKVNPSEITIMTFNVENLFDNIVDTERDDFTYLASCLKKNPSFAPQHLAFCETQGSYKGDCLNLDWNDSVIDKKMSAVAKGILQLNGKGPDILMVQEVENIRALRMLNDTYLKSAGYRTVELIEGSDRRGIDVGVLSRLEKAGSVKAHQIQWSPRPEGQTPKGTRAILQVPLKLPNGKTLHVFSLHFPSQSNPVLDRKDAIATLISLFKSVPSGDLAVAGGDFNIPTSEEKTQKLFRSLVDESLMVSHFEKMKWCQQVCTETESPACTTCQNFSGSHYFSKNNEWSFLDALIFSPDFKSGQNGYRFVPESTSIPRDAPTQVGANGAPNRFNVTTGTGIADHFPIAGVIQLNK